MSINRHSREGGNPQFRINAMDPRQRHSGMTVIVFVITLLLPALTFAKPPHVGKIPDLDFDPPQVTRHVLSNGVIVHLLENHELPIFDLSLQFKLSPADQPKGKLGTIGFMGDLWRNGGTKKRPPEKLNEELELLAASVETSADLESAEISVSCLSKDINQALGIFSDVLLNPQFRNKQLKVIKASMINELKRKNETPRQIAGRAFRDVLFGQEHVYGRNLTKARVKKIKRGDLAKLHKKLIVPDHAIISVSGDFNQDDIIQKLEMHFKDWKPVGRKVMDYDYSVVAAPPGKVFYVEKDFNQSRILFGALGIDRHSPDIHALTVANYILGASGTSRLFAQIRSRLGLAYVVGSFYSEMDGRGFIGAASQTRADATMAAVQAMRNELEKMSRDPVEIHELAQAKEAKINSFVFNFDSPANIVARRATQDLFGYPSDYLDTYVDKIKAISAEDVLDISQKYFSPDKMKLVIVGNKGKFKEKLESAGPVTEIPLNDID